MASPEPPHAMTHPHDPTAPPLYSDLTVDADMVELVEMFVDELPERVESIAGALAGHDFETLTRLGHQLKGAGTGYGFPAITDAGARVEDLARTLTASGGAAELASIRDAVAELADLCRRASVRTDYQGG